MQCEDNKNLVKASFKKFYFLTVPAISSRGKSEELSYDISNCLTFSIDVKKKKEWLKSVGNPDLIPGELEM